MLRNGEESRLSFGLLDEGASFRFYLYRETVVELLLGESCRVATWRELWSCYLEGVVEVLLEEGINIVAM